VHTPNLAQPAAIGQHNRVPSQRPAVTAAQLSAPELPIGVATTALPTALPAGLQARAREPLTSLLLADGQAREGLTDQQQIAATGAGVMGRGSSSGAVGLGDGFGPVPVSLVSVRDRSGGGSSI